MREHGNGPVRTTLTLGMAITVCIAAASVSLPGGTPDEHPARVHAEGKAVEQAVLDATLAMLREDAAAARKALDRLEEQCRRLNSDDEEAYGSAIVSYDQAYHTTLDRSREYAARGKVDDAFNQFVWVQRTCRVCHGFARERGLPKAPEPTGK